MPISLALSHNTPRDCTRSNNTKCWRELIEQSPPIVHITIARATRLNDIPEKIVNYLRHQLKMGKLSASKHPVFVQIFIRFQVKHHSKMLLSTLQQPHGYYFIAKFQTHLSESTE